MFRVVAEDEALRGLGPVPSISGLAGPLAGLFGASASLQSVTAGSCAMFGTVTRPWRMPRVTTGSTQSPLGSKYPAKTEGCMPERDLFASIVENEMLSERDGFSVGQ